MKDNEIWQNVVIKNTCDQVFSTFNDLPKATRIIDNKKVFYKGSQKYYRVSTLSLNHWF